MCYLEISVSMRGSDEGKDFQIGLPQLAERPHWVSVGRVKGAPGAHRSNSSNLKGVMSNECDTFAFVGGLRAHGWYMMVSSRWGWDERITM